MDIENFVRLLGNKLNDRYEILDDNDDQEFDREFPAFSRKAILRIRRKSYSAHENHGLIAYGKTLLIAELSTQEEIHISNSWAANVKNQLIDPQTSDVYLFVLMNNETFNLESRLAV